MIVYAFGVIYNVLQENPFSTYGESFIILVQNIILVFLLWSYAEPAISAGSAIGVTVVFVALVAGALQTPPEYQAFLSLIGTPLMIMSRIPQIINNFSQGHTGQLAFITVALNFVGALARIFTTLTEVGDDYALLAGFIISVTLNGLLLLQIVMYWSATKKATQKKDD